MHNADSALLAFLHSTDKSEQDYLLSELILTHATPLIRHTLRQRLGFYVNHNGANAYHPEAEDVYQNVITKLVQRLRELQSQHEESGIRNYRQYVVRVATNACYDYLRAKSPTRTRLKYNLRDLLERHRDFKVWKNENLILLCGFADWANQKPSSPGSNRIQVSEDMLEQLLTKRLAGEDLQRVPQTRIVAEIFNFVGHAIELDQLVEIIASLLQIKDQPLESLDQNETSEQQLIAPITTGEAHLEGIAKLRQFWEEVQRLPPKQRDTICFGFVDEGGDDMLSLLVAAGIASLPQLATAFERPLEELVKIWKEVPMDNATLAAHLGATRQQVNKWRFLALKELGKRMMPK